MSEPVSIHPAAVSALAVELRAVAAGLADAGDPCRAAQAHLEAGLGGATGALTGAAPAAWGGLSRLLASECEALAGTLTGAVESYAEADAALSAGIAQHGLPGNGGPR